jgi:hypothetical protein
LQEKLNGNAAAKEHLMILLRSPTPGMKERIATALAHLLNKDDLARAYLFYGGLSVLLDSACPGAWDTLRAAPVLEEGSSEETAFLKVQGLAVEALEKLTAQCRSAEASSNSYIPLEPEKQVRPALVMSWCTPVCSTHRQNSNVAVARPVAYQLRYPNYTKTQWFEDTTVCMRLLLHDIGRIRMDVDDSRSHLGLDTV